MTQTESNALHKSQNEQIQQGQTVHKRRRCKERHLYNQSDRKQSE